jgi:hypothetical protein
MLLVSREIRGFVHLFGQTLFLISAEVIKGGQLWLELKLVAKLLPQPTKRSTARTFTPASALWVAKMVTLVAFMLTAILLVLLVQKVAVLADVPKRPLKYI